MSAAHVTIYIGEDAELTQSVHVLRSGDGVRAWVHVDGYEASVWGSPMALRRFAAAVVSAADAADRSHNSELLSAPAASQAA